MSDSRLYSKSPPAALLSDDDEDEEVEIQDEDDFVAAEIYSDDEDGFGNEDDVDVAVDAYAWKIHHTHGHHRLQVQDFLSSINDAHDEGARALEMLQQRYTMDYGSGRAGSRSTLSTDQYHPVFFLDMIIIVGRPMKPLTRISDRFFDNVTLSFRHWRSSYSCKHIHGFSFDLSHRTFRLATAATRESWFIVMHPIGGAVAELPSSRREQRQRAEEASKSSALEPTHAQFLAGYIKQLFLLNDLLGEGVEASWILDGPQKQNITFNKWTTFQEVFMENWEEYVQDHTQDSFWHENQPAFHAYDYGANIEIQVNDYLRSMPSQASLRPAEDSSNDSEGGFEDDSHVRESRSPSHLATGRRRRRGGSRDESDARLGSQHDSISDPPLNLYPAGLRQLKTELEGKYTLNHISSISYAIAVDLNCVDGSAVASNDAPARCLLANRNSVAREYRGARDFTFYPLAFHPAYGNFSSSRPPAFLNNHVLTTMRDNMSYVNGGADPLRYGYFQAYSNIKRSVRHGPDDLLATKGLATAALTLPESEAATSSWTLARRQRFRRQFLGQTTPDDPDASKPFAREQRRVIAAIKAEEFAFRLEQVIHVQVGRLTRSQRRFQTILQPILQLMRFFLCEPAQYSHILHSFRPTVFPGVLGTYAGLFNAALNELRQRMDARKAQGVDVALAEGVAAIDRLGSYCFTGFPRSLMGSVMKPLQTIESIEHGAWPYLDPAMLDLQAVGGQLNLALWPRGVKDRPILMHVAALSFYYGVAIGISRHTHVWFQDLGGKDMTGPSRLRQFFDDFFEDLWQPEMVRFVQKPLERDIRRRESQDLPEHAPPLLDDQRSLLKRWAQSSHPFSWREFEPIMLTLITPYSSGPSSTATRARQDFSRDLYRCCRSVDATHRTSFAGAQSTWFAILRHVLQHFAGGHMDEKHWVAAISAGMLSHSIECVPGVYHSHLSFRRMVRLVGYSVPMQVLSAPVGSLKRAAMEAQQEAKRQRSLSTIDFGCPIPFTQIPALLKEGFESLERLFSRGDQQIREHYQVVRNCVESCLGNPLCDLMLMLVLTLASCSVTPTVAPHTREFSDGARRDPAMFAANLTTRMLWFLCPRQFPWRENNRIVLRVPEMVKKIEHKGVSNRMLLTLGWVKVIHGQRDSPRNDDLQLQDTELLLACRQELLKLRQDAPAFISVVFHSRDPRLWLDRCSQIIQE